MANCIKKKRFMNDCSCDSMLIGIIISSMIFETRKILSFVLALRLYCLRSEPT